jgi:restriction endonuclease S subunit
MLSKMRPCAEGGRQPRRHRLQRLAAVHRRRRLRRERDPPLDLENDWLEAIVALPDHMFYNTGISTYIWMLTNRKPGSARARSSSSTPATSGRRCDLAIARPRRGFSGSFLKRLFDSRYVKACFEVTANGLTRVGLGQYAISNISLPFPPEDEQRAIATFLDRETAKIDALVNEQRRLIDLLKEKRQAVISHAVTKGLDPSVPMRDSGVEWLGEIPAHWRLARVKQLCKTVSGGTPNTAQQDLYYADEETGIPWVRTLDLTNDVVTSVEVHITQQALRDTACKILPPGTVMVAMYGGDGTVGKNGLLMIPAAINQAVCGLLPAEDLVPEFLFRYMQFYRPFWMIGAESSRKDPNISQERVRAAPIPLPPLAEQEAIAKYLSDAIGQHQSLSLQAEASIELLQERRAALISAAVTGKIDIREVASRKTEVA